MSSAVIRRLRALTLVLLAWLFLPLWASAAEHTVTSLADSGAGSLRAVLLTAQAGDRIVFGVTGTITVITPLTVDKSLELVGPGAGQLTLSGGSGWSLQPHLRPTSGSRIMEIRGAGTTVLLEGLRFQDGFVSGAGLAGAPGGVNGGAIRVEGAANITVRNCRFDHNHALDRSTDPPVGGAIHLDQGVLSVEGSSFHDNYAGAGGAICNYDGVVTLTNCTLSRNVAYAGGAFIHRPAGRTSVLIHCTLADNLSLNRHDSGGVSVIHGKVQLRNSLVARNSEGAHVVNGTRYADLDPNWEGAGSFESLDGNLLGSRGDVAFASLTKDRVGTPGTPQVAGLRPLDLTLLWGGSTPVQPTQVDSPARNLGGTAVVSTDQRGRTRDALVDAGAFEAQPVTLSGSAGVVGVTVTASSGPSPATSAGDGSYSLSFPEGWSGTLTPARPGFTFSPTSRTYTDVVASQSGQNFTATPITYTIQGNAGRPGAVLSYLDGTLKMVVADGSGNYTLTVSWNWSGTVTPALGGYTFAPASRAYTNVLASVSGETYTATPITYVLSGNAGRSGVTLAWTGAIPQTTTSDASGAFSLTVPWNASGTLTPSLTGYTFTPADRVYTGVLADASSQDFTPVPITYTVSGTTGIEGVTLTWTDGTVKTTTSGPGGAYSFTVSYGWSGTVTPSRPGFTFAPASQAYANVLGDQANQDYGATAITYTIQGNAGVAGAVLAYTDGTAKSVVADASGNYTLTVSWSWSGTVTPSLNGYTFAPASRSYTSVQTSLVGEAYSATPITYVLSGNAGRPGVSLSWAGAVPQTTSSDANGAYSLTLPWNASGTLTPSLAGYTFTPANRVYAGVLADAPSQDFTPVPITYTVSGTTGIEGVTLTWNDGTTKTITSGPGGAYSFTVSYRWSGTVTPSRPGYTFAPTSRVYSDVLGDQANQDYGATAITYTIQGNVGVSGATLSFSDGAPKTATSGSDGSYSLTVSWNWSGTVTPTKPGYSFTEGFRTYSGVQADAMGQDFTPVLVPPTLPTAVDITEEAFTVQWSANAAATAYRVDVSTTADFSSFLAGYQDRAVTETQLRVSGLNPNADYHVRVRATNAQHTSLSSPTARVQTQKAAPVVATEAATDITASEATLNGRVEARNDATQVAFEYGLTSLYGATLAAVPETVSGLTPTAVTARLTGLTPGTVYHLRVRAQSGGGTTYGLDRTLLTLPAAPALGAPSAVGPGGFTIAWAGVSSAERYELWVATQADFGGGLVGGTPLDLGGATTHTLTGLSPASTYHVRVRAANATGWGAFSAPVQVGLVPAAPTLSATDLRPEGFRALWSLVPGADTYRLDVSTEASFSSFLPSYQDAEVGSGTSWVVTGLEPSRTYHARLRAVGPGGTSAASPTVTLRTLGRAPQVTLLAPDPLSVTSATLRGTVNAQNEGTQAHFQLWGDDGTDRTFPLARVEGAMDTPVTLPVDGLRPRTRYRVTLVARNATGTSQTDLLSFTTPGRPVVIHGLSVASASAGELLTVTGEGFMEASSVRIGTLEAVFLVISDTEILVTLPPGARSGPVHVVTPSGAAVSPTVLTVKKEG